MRRIITRILSLYWHSIYTIYFTLSIYALKLKEYGRRFPNAGYGQMFMDWVKNPSTSGYRSYGNGSAMRVSPVAYAFDTLDTVLHQAKLSAAVTHNHGEGIKGAQAVASAIFLARTGHDKAAIQNFIQHRFGYNLNKSLDEIRPTYQFDSSCQGSVPQAIIAFLESTDFEDAIRKAVSLGGDSDTIACITGSIAEAHYRNIPENLLDKTNLILDFGLQRVLQTFNERYKWN
ncbi:MAG: ADP-ribosylglycohydrolase family protein [Anaerolineaceae bacterium]|nr:ADP-ribosylglycohydrolase family protein [Anaerolineaceae bacterium]